MRHGNILLCAGRYSRRISSSSRPNIQRALWIAAQKAAKPTRDHQAGGVGIRRRDASETASIHCVLMAVYRGGQADSGIDRALALALQAELDEVLESGELWPG